MIDKLFVKNYSIAMKFTPIKIKNRREELGLSLKGLAVKMGNICSFGAIHQWERGVAAPTSIYLPALADALGVDITYFFE